MMKKVGCLVLVILASVVSLLGQNFEINNETITTCTGSFQDDNGGVGNDPGTEGASYSGTSYTFTICPDNPGDVIQVNFVAFNLYTNPNPNNSDYLAIFDGDSPAANSMGSYTGQQLSGIPVTGTVNNVTGCLTFVFQVSNSSSGDFAGWEGLISCTTPCDPPTASSTIVDPVPDLENSVSVCLNTPISFEDNGSSAAPGFTIENYIWNFDDGTVEEGPNLTSVQHIFTEPGEYIVTLTVEDNNGCTNLNLVPLQVLVSTIPIFQTDFSEQVCLGGDGYINGNPVQSQTWTALPPQVIAGETFLADGAGFSYSSTLGFDFFDDDQVLESCDDLYGISINMEHSYMGDLDILITCPDGTTVFLFEQAGGGTYLGEAVDDGSTDPGIGYDYVWSPTATNGTWGDNSNGVNILPAGTYESNEDMCQLVGCPLNGDWTIEVIDNLAIDNGYIFEWGIDLNPTLFPGITTFTPTIGLGLDSTWVTGPNISSTSLDGNDIAITPTDFGEYDYTLFASNNFGCTFDTTITVNVVPGPEITLPEELPFCSDDFTLVPEIVNEFDQGPCVFTLVLDNDLFGFNNSGVNILFDGAVEESIVSTAVNEEIEVEVPTGTTLSLEYVFSTWGEGTGNSFSFFDDAGTLLFQSDVSPSQGVLFEEVVYCVGPGQVQFSWEPGEFLDSPNAPTTAGEVDEPVVFTLTAFPAGFEGCASSEDILVYPTEIPDLGESAELTLCSSDSEVLMINALGGNPEDVGAWFDPSNTLVPTGTFSPGNDAPGTYTYLFQSPDCPVEVELEIDVADLEISVSNDTTICQNGIAELAVDLSYEPLSYNVIWNGGLFTGDIINVQPNINPQAYNVMVEYGDNCFTSTEEVVVSTLPGLQMDGIASELICLGDSVSASPNSPSGGMEPYAFSWTSDFTNQQGASVTLNPSQTTTYTLEFSDACESTPISDEFTISLNPIISSEFLALDPSGCFPHTTQFQGQADDLSIISSVVWEFGDGFTSNSINVANHTYLEPGDYDVSLTINGTDGCVYSNTEENFVSAYNVPSAEFQPIESTVVLPNATFEFENYSLDNDENLWTFDIYGTSNDENPEFTFPIDTPSDLEIELVTINNDGCSDTISYNVYLVNGFALYAPNSFTPDGDGINEYWEIKGVDIDETDFVLNIWNRDGKPVFQSVSPYDVWDGSYLSGDHYVPNGIYTFQIKTRAKTDGEKQEITGFITILR